MNVKDIMTPNPEYVEVDSSVHSALGKMLELDVRHLPVLQDGELVGMLSDRDIGLYSAPESEELIDLEDLHVRLKEKVSKIMQGGVLSVDVESDVPEVIRLMIDNKIGALPVVDSHEGRLVGIVSYIDVLKAAEPLL